MIRKDFLDPGQVIVSNQLQFNQIIINDRSCFSDIHNGEYFKKLNQGIALTFWEK